MKKVRRGGRWKAGHCNHTSDDGSQTKRHSANKRKDGPIRRTLPQRYFVGKNNTDDDVEPRAGDALDRSTEEEQPERVGGRCRADGAADEHEGHSDLDRAVAAEDVGHAAPEGDEGCGGEIEGRYDPVLLLKFAYGKGELALERCCSIGEAHTKL